MPLRDAPVERSAFFLPSTNRRVCRREPLQALDRQSQPAVTQPICAAQLPLADDVCLSADCYHRVMSTTTRELLDICERLPDAERIEVVGFAKALLERRQTPESRKAAFDKWIEKARGAGKPGVTTDQIMEMTRGET